MSNYKCTKQPVSVDIRDWLNREMLGYSNTNNRCRQLGFDSETVRKAIAGEPMVKATVIRLVKAYRAQQDSAQSVLPANAPVNL